MQMVIVAQITGRISPSLSKAGHALLESLCLLLGQVDNITEVAMVSPGL